jgi:hypothetical protein
VHLLAKKALNLSKCTVKQQLEPEYILCSRDSAVSAVIRLRSRRFGFRISAGTRSPCTPHNVQNGCWPHPSSSSVGTSLLYRCYSGRGKKFTTHFHLQPKLKGAWDCISTAATCHYGIDMDNFTFSFISGVQLFLRQTFKPRNKIYSCSFTD